MEFCLNFSIHAKCLRKFVCFIFLINLLSYLLFFLRLPSTLYHMQHGYINNETTQSKIMNLIKFESLQTENELNNQFNKNRKTKVIHIYHSSDNRDHHAKITLFVTKIIFQRRCNITMRTAQIYRPNNYTMTSMQHSL